MISAGLAGSAGNFGRQIGGPGKTCVDQGFCLAKKNFGHQGIMEVPVAIATIERGEFLGDNLVRLAIRQPRCRRLVHPDLGHRQDRIGSDLRR